MMQRVAERRTWKRGLVSPFASTAQSQIERGVRVLVVDPSSGLRRLFALELEEAGYSAVGAEYPRDAMQLAVEDPPGAIVLNATTAPEASRALISALRSEERLRNVPVVGIACLPGGEQRLLDAGADCCLRRIPARGDILKAVDWVLSVYGDRATP